MELMFFFVLFEEEGKVFHCCTGGHEDHELARSFRPDDRDEGPKFLVPFADGVKVLQAGWCPGSILAHILHQISVRVKWTNQQRDPSHLLFDCDCDRIPQPCPGKVLHFPGLGG